MNLRKKKQLAARVLNAGKNRICFNTESLAEIKEAITKQDIKDLHKEGAIFIKPIKGKKKIKKRKTKKGFGKIKKKLNKRKKRYVKMTRKLRAYLNQLKLRGEIDKDLFLNSRKKIKMKDFRSKMHLKEYLRNIEKNKQEKSLKAKITKSKEQKEKKEKLIKTKNEKEYKK